jgi:hypothetical protein
MFVKLPSIKFNENTPVDSFYNEESLRIKINQPILIHTVALQLVCTALKTNENEDV